MLSLGPFGLLSGLSGPARSVPAQARPRGLRTPGRGAGCPARTRWNRASRRRAGGRAAGAEPRLSVAVAIAAEAGGQVVVDDAAGLHGGIGGHRAGEREAMP